MLAIADKHLWLYVAGPYEPAAATSESDLRPLVTAGAPPLKSGGCQRMCVLVRERDLPAAAVRACNQVRACVNHSSCNYVHTKLAKFENASFPHSRASRPPRWIHFKTPALCF